ncbi:MAG: hypothetical protein IPK97_17660 [Ahniella sp.]|nr:hypothetical protein [Ahniella sp.]
MIASEPDGSTQSILEETPQYSLLSEGVLLPARLAMGAKVLPIDGAKVDASTACPCGDRYPIRSSIFNAVGDAMPALADWTVTPDPAPLCWK